MVRTSHIMLPHIGARINTLNRSMVGSGNSFLLDGGLGGQSSYRGIDDYMEITNRKGTIAPRGEGLADKITSKLQKLNIAPPTKQPKRKNISLSI